MRNTQLMYIEIVEQGSEEKVIIAVDASNSDTVNEILIRRIEKQYDRQDYITLHEYIEDVIEDLDCGIIEIETILSIYH